MNSRYTEVWPEQESVLEQESTGPVTVNPGEVVLGKLVGFSGSGEPLVTFPGVSQGLIAMSTIAVNREHEDRQVALLFTNGDLTKPIIMGLIYSPLLDILSNVEYVTEREESQLTGSGQLNSEKVDLVSAKSNSELDNLMIDGERVILEGKEEIVLKCGDASITLTKAGKILIRGKYLLNRSSGVNRILGGSVQVN